MERYEVHILINIVLGTNQEAAHGLTVVLESDRSTGYPGLTLQLTLSLGCFGA